MDESQKKSPKQMYKAAHDQHYKEEDLQGAKEKYQALIAVYPNGKEAGYAKTQLKNIEEAGKRKVSTYRQETPSERLSKEFLCRMCKHLECELQDVDLGPTGLYRGSEEEAHHFRAASCLRCGHTDFFRKDIMERDDNFWKSDWRPLYQDFE